MVTTCDLLQTKCHFWNPTSLTVLRHWWRRKSSASRLFTQPFIQGADQRKHQSSASSTFGRGINRWPVNSSHKGPVTRKMFPFDELWSTSAQVIDCCLTAPSEGLRWVTGHYLPSGSMSELDLSVHGIIGSFEIVKPVMHQIKLHKWNTYLCFVTDT